MHAGLKRNIKLFLPYFEVRILTKTLKAIQVFQLGVGHSQMHLSL